MDLPDHAREQWLQDLSEPFPGANEILRNMLKEDASGEGDGVLDTLLKVPLSQDASGTSADTGPFKPNAQIGNYRLERVLGHGGMGSVWLARRTDELVNRSVALKLPHLHLQSALFSERFARERDILANLTHPNIAHLYDAGVSAEGQPYLAMEYVAGESLTQYCTTHDLSIQQRLELFLQVLSAVHYAHTQHIIHRDLKPSNILVREGGQVVLLDFGVAKLLVEGEAGETALTRHGGAALTPDYASPEQISGETLGAATDIYSLGVVLYELLAGRRPYEFKHSTRRALELAILSTDPRPPSEMVTQRADTREAGFSAATWCNHLKGDLDTIVLKTLKKAPADRYLTAGDFAEDLRRYLRRDAVSARPDTLSYRFKKLAHRHQSALQGAAVAGLAVTALAIIAVLNTVHLSNHHALVSAIDPKSLAVLPFVDMSEKRDQEYFSDGLAEELIEQLGQIPGLKVIARTSSFSFKGKSDDIPTIVSKLKVANLLEGSIRRSGNHLRVSTQLIHADSGQPAWSETFDREFKDVFAIQDEIAAAVVTALKVQLAGGSTAARGHGTTNPQAYNAYLLGRQFDTQGTVPTWRQAIEAYQNAIRLDPRYADAYADLAVSEYYLAENTGNVALGRLAEQAAQKAIDLDPRLTTGYSVRGSLRYLHRYDWVGAESDFKKALEIEPTNSRVLARYGKLLRYVGRTEQATTMLRKAIELDPLQYSDWQNLGIALAESGDHAGAYDAFKHALAIQPGNANTAFALGTLQLLEGKAQEALVTFQSNSDEDFRGAGVAMAEHSLGDAKASEQALEKLITTGAGDAAYQIVEVYAWRREKDKAFEWLERAYRQQDGGLAGIKNDLRLASLRGDPRYVAMLRKLNFPP